MSEKKVSYSALKQERGFLRLVAANCVNRFGDSIDAIAFSWMAYEITGSAAVMAAMLGLNFLPTVLLQPLSGAWVDRISKKKMMVAGDIARAVTVLLCVILLQMNQLTTPVLIAFTMLNSVFEAFRQPAGGAIVPMLLSEDHYSVGIGLESTMSRVCELVGMGLAGGVVSLVGVSGALLIDFSTFLISAFIISTIRLQENIDHTKKTTLKSILQTFREGLQYVLKEKKLMFLLLMAMVINLTVVPINCFSTPYIVDDIKAGPWMLSAIEIVMVVAMGLGSYVTPKIKKMSAKALILVSGLMSGVTFVLMWAAPLFTNMWLCYGTLFLSMALMGFSAGVLNVVFAVERLKIVPKEMLGRVSGIGAAIACLAMPVGSFVCSAIANFVSVPQVMLITGIATIMLYLFLNRSKEMRAFE